MGSAAHSDVSWWEANYYPAAGEVVAWREHRGARDTPVFGGEDPHREKVSESNGERAVRRARTRIRRYATANLLDRMIVLTWAEQGHDLRAAQRDVRRFIRYGLRQVLGYRGPYVVGWERHKSGAWHCNILVDRNIEHGALWAEWARGFVWIKRWKSRRGESKRDGARSGARYVAKYIAKDLAELPAGIHRYEVAQGYVVRAVRVYGTSPTSILVTIGRPVAYRFDAAAPEAGRGPPLMWAALGGA